MPVSRVYFDRIACLPAAHTPIHPSEITAYQEKNSRTVLYFYVMYVGTYVVGTLPKVFISQWKEDSL